MRILADNYVREQDETFQVVLSNPPANAEIAEGKGTATGTILEGSAVEISIDHAAGVTERAP